METSLKLLQSLQFAAPIYFLALTISVLLGLFLYWRAGRHELHDSSFLFDLSLFCTLGGLIFGRFLAFVFNFEYFNFSIYKLIFFHMFGGFSFWGFLTGVLVFGFLYLRKNKENLFNMLDLASSAFVFSGFIFYFFKLLSSFTENKSINIQYLFIVIFYLTLFFTIKRLSTKKRHKGFFAGLYFLTLGAFYLFLNLIENWNKFEIKNLIREELVMPIIFTVFGGIIWYKFSRRTLKNDLKGFFAYLLLQIFKIRRAAMSTDEAGRIARSVLFLPYFIFKAFLVSLRMLSKELTAAFWEFLYILGLRKY